MARSVPLGAMLLMASPIAVPGQSGANPQSALTVGLVATLLPATAGMVMWPRSDGDPSAAALVIASGIVLGPAIGYWSAGMTGRGWKSMGIRTGLLLVSFVPAFGICGMGCTVGDPDYDLAWAVTATGAGLGAISAWHDLTRMKQHVRDHRARQMAPAVAITPTYAPRTHSLGMRVSVVF